MVPSPNVRIAAVTTSFVDEYRGLRPRSARSVGRHTALTTLALATRLSGRLDAALARPRVQLLYLHHVFADEESNFRSLIEHLLARGQRIITTTEAVFRLARGEVDAPYVSISIDDGLKNNTRAARVLESYGLTGCFYICPGAIEERDPAAIARFCRQVLHLPPIEFLDWNDVEVLLGAGHEIGNHTTHHARLVGLSLPQLEDEVGSSTETLRARAGHVEHFAWPFGGFDDIDPYVAEIVASLGYLSMASAVRGCHLGGSADERPIPVLRRDHVVAAWPLDHVLYFMASATRGAAGVRTMWPDAWAKPAGDG